MIELQIAFLALAMIFLHVFDDFYLQTVGSLAKLKQQVFWEQSPGYNKKYRFDYIVPLWFHGLTWSIMVHLPLIVLFYFSGILFEAAGFYLLLSIIIHGDLHSFIDHLKANRFVLNLVQDQLLHLLQIAVILWTMGVVLYG